MDLFGTPIEDIERLYGKFEAAIMQYLNAKLLEYRDKGFITEEQSRLIAEYEINKMAKRSEG